MKNNLNIAIIDDDISIVNQLKSIIELGIPKDKIVGYANNIQEGISLINSERPELVLLDIELGSEVGFDIFAKLGNCSFSYIVISGYDKYAYQAIKGKAIDYLLKPINSEELINSITNFKNTFNRNMLNNLHLERQHKIAIHSLKEIKLVDPDDILYCEALNTYTKFVLNKKTEFEVISSKPIKDFEQILGPFAFVRCHQSYLVNLKNITSIKKGRFSLEIVFDNKKIIPVSRQRKEWFLDIILNSEGIPYS